MSRTTSLSEACEFLEQSACEVLLIEGRLFIESPRQLTAQLPIRLKQTQIALFADRLSDTQLEFAQKNRVIGFCSMEDSLKELAESLPQVATGQCVISPHLLPRFRRDPETRAWVVNSRDQLAQLTDRQLEVLSYLAQGLRVKEIADQLRLSDKAIESHKFRIMSRLNIRDRVQLCRWAIREGLIQA
ncbi:MAG: response regulator transcription factor [Planctomycetaceae bacterium]|nr:response regulator transcription factor [Planctomycetaceae bacterium]